jgi:hypothetical protein
MELKRLVGIFIVLFVPIKPLFAESFDLKAAQALENPLQRNAYDKYIALPFEDDTNFGLGTHNGTQTTINAKPLVPFRLTPTYDLIVRTIAPIFTHQPSDVRGQTANGPYISGWGDINPTFFVSPAYFKDILWGVGPTFFIPASTNSQSIGSGKWSVGPELAIFVMPGNWLFGILTSNIWSIAGDANRSPVGQFSFEYYVTYNFDNGWNITTSPTITANWKSQGNQQWVVPFGAGFGKTFQMAALPMSFSIQAYYNVIRPSGIGPNWQLQASWKILLPATATMG